jgi:hypothetical protein
MIASYFALRYGEQPVRIRSCHAAGLPGTVADASGESAFGQWIFLACQRKEMRCGDIRLSWRSFGRQRRAGDCPRRPISLP